MATNKSYAERIKIQKEIMEKAELKIKELEEAAKKEEDEKKQKKIDSILRDVEKALSQSPILELSKGSDEYKRFLAYIRNGFGGIEL